VPTTTWSGVSPSSVSLLVLHVPLTEVHQHLVDRHTVQPCREGRVTSEAADLPVQLYKYVLCQVFGLMRVLEHSQTDRINPAVMPLIDLFESCHVTLSRKLRQLQILRSGDIDLFFLGFYVAASLDIDDSLCQTG
jgi:hypothetical protein